MRRAILRAAAKLFRADGCTGTSLARVARRSPAPTSMSISAASWIFCLPWRALPAAACGNAGGKCRPCRARVKNCAAASRRGCSGLLLEAFATFNAKDRYSRDLLLPAEAMVAEALRAALRAARCEDIAHLAFMA